MIHLTEDMVRKKLNIGGLQGEYAKGLGLLEFLITKRNCLFLTYAKGFAFLDVTIMFTIVTWLSI